LTTHGRPTAFHSDKHSVFRVARKEAKGGQGMTQFGRAVRGDAHLLGRPTSTSQRRAGPAVWHFVLAGTASCRRATDALPRSQTGDVDGERTDAGIGGTTCRHPRVRRRSLVL